MWYGDQALTEESFDPTPPFTLLIRHQSEVGPWIIPLDVQSHTTRFPTIQQAHSRSDIRSNFGGWTTSRTKNRNVNALLKPKYYFLWRLYSQEKLIRLAQSKIFMNILYFMQHEPFLNCELWKSCWQQEYLFRIEEEIYSFSWMCFFFF